MPQPAPIEPTSSPHPMSTSCRLLASDSRLEKGLIARVADSGDHQDRIRSGRSHSGRRIAISAAGASQILCGRIRSATPRLATRTVCSGSTRQRSYRPRHENMAARPVAPFRLPGRHQWDIALSKIVSLGGTRRLQFRADLINAFNQTQFLDVTTVCSGDDDV